MEDAMFDLDDNWGTTEETHYPKLPAKENASKTVQKRRIKAAKKVVSMLSSAVIPGKAQPTRSCACKLAQVHEQVLAAFHNVSSTPLS